MGTYGTRFVETEALLAVSQGDEDIAREILDGMLPGERRAFVETLNRLATLASCYCTRCGKRVEDHTDLVTLVSGSDRERICRDCDTIRGDEQRAARARRKEIEKLVQDAVMPPSTSTYAHLAEVTGIEVDRLVDMRIGRADVTDDEIAKLRAFLAERTVQP